MRGDLTHETKLIKMTEPELEVLEDASREIKMLRRQLELKSARLDMFDSINAMLHTDLATKQQGMSPDVCAQLDKFIAAKK